MAWQEILTFHWLENISWCQDINCIMCIKGPTWPFSQHQYFRVLKEIFCLWRVTYSDESAQAILYHFPGPQASLHHPHPPFYWHVISWRSRGAAADQLTFHVRHQQPDRSSGSRHPRTKTVNQRVSQHRDCRRQDPRPLEETPATDNRRQRRRHRPRWRRTPWHTALRQQESAPKPGRARTQHICQATQHDNEVRAMGINSRVPQEIPGIERYSRLHEVQHSRLHGKTSRSRTAGTQSSLKPSATFCPC